MGNIGWVQLLIVAVIVLVVFGSKKLRNLGGDLGESVKGFKKAMNKDEASTANIESTQSKDSAESNVENSTVNNTEKSAEQTKDKEQV